MNKIVNQKFIVLAVALLVSMVQLSITSSTAVYADSYGGRTKERFVGVSKGVRIEGESDFEDKITDVEKYEVIEFRIKVKNTGNSTLNDMKMHDYLPDELVQIGDSGLTEYWDGFDEDETKKFYIKVKVKDEEYDRKNFEKCVVNKVEIERDGDEMASDTATVCYGDGEVSELPETGVDSPQVLGFIGLALVITGLLMRKFRFRA